jgi:dCMP deaminase
MFSLSQFSVKYYIQTSDQRHHGFRYLSSRARNPVENPGGELWSLAGEYRQNLYLKGIIFMVHLDWDSYFISEAYMAALKSKDPSTQVGSVVVGPNHEIRGKGYNGLCRGEDDDNPAFDVRPFKYSVYEHAERNSLYNMVRVGIPSDGCTMYCTWGPPCADCARAIIQSGIKEIVCHAENPGSPGWAESTTIAADLLQRLGVNLRFWSGVPSIREIRCSGKIHRFSTE